MQCWVTSSLSTLKISLTEPDPSWMNAWYVNYESELCQWLTCYFFHWFNFCFVTVKFTFVLNDCCADFVGDHGDTDWKEAFEEDKMRKEKVFCLFYAIGVCVCIIGNGERKKKIPHILYYRYIFCLLFLQLTCISVAVGWDS